MVYLKAIQKITPMDVSVSGTIDEKTYLKKFRGASAPLTPHGSAYAQTSSYTTESNPTLRLLYTSNQGLI